MVNPASALVNSSITPANWVVRHYGAVLALSDPIIDEQEIRQA